MASRTRATTQATIKDVARAAGVSATTVSNVLNGRTYAMTEETLRRIEDAIHALNYRPSRIARGLVTRHTATIGLIVSEIETPLFLQAMPPMEALARSAGYNLLLCVAQSTQDETDAIGLLLEKQVDAVIFLSSSEYRDDSHLAELRRVHLPVALVNRINRHPDFDQINWDQTRGLADAVGYLCARGQRRIAHLVGPASRGSTAERLAGYRLGLQEQGIPYRDDYVCPGDFTASADCWQRSVEQLLALDEPPAAIIAADDVVAAVAMGVVHNQGLRVPQDVAVLGIDGQPFTQYLNPPLTTLRLPTVEAGRLAMEMVLERMTGRREEALHRMLPCPLLERGSC